MRAAHVTDGTPTNILQTGDRGPHGMPLLARWAPSDRKYVMAELNWSNLLDAALGRELLRFRPGIDQYDA